MNDMFADAILTMILRAGVEQGTPKSRVGEYSYICWFLIFITFNIFQLTASYLWRPV